MNRHWVEADLRIATGFIEPHFYAGFSGGSKAVIPGIAGLETVRHFHRATLIAQPSATWAKTSGNPLQRLTREMTAFCPPHFIVNVTLNRAKEITGVYAGDVTAAHDAGCAAAFAETTVSVPRRYPVVVTTNSGFPLDQNLYQGVKGMSAAARIIRPGGTIILAAECSDGIPTGSPYDLLLREESSIEGVLARLATPGFSQPEQWQAQLQGVVQSKARVLVHSSLPEDLLRRAHLEPCPDIGEAVRTALLNSGPGARVAVLPLGPLTIPYLQSHED
jgi:nickel-dependent lactate racemase